MHSLHAVEVTAGPDVVVTGTSATVRWMTDLATGTRLSYGTNELLLTHRAEGELAQHHVVQLSELTLGKDYFYSYGTARLQLGKGKFTTATGATTKPAATSPKPLLQRLFPKLAATVKPFPPPLPLPVAPPARTTWAHFDSLPDHFARHGRDFSAKSEDDYAAQAWQFLQRAKREGLPMKWDDADHSLRVFDPETRSFASYDQRGKTRTYFKPSNANYWSGQPGRNVTASQLAF